MLRLLPMLALLAACGGPAPVGPAMEFPEEPLLTQASSGGALKISLRTSPQPPQAGLLDVQYQLTRADGTPATGVGLQVTPFMPAMGHGTAAAQVEDLGGGVFRLQDLRLAMPGSWELRTTFTGAADDSAVLVLQLR